MKTLLVVCAFLAITHTTIAQQDSTGTRTLQFKAGINYNNKLHYFGRTDSLASSGFFPMAELWLRDSWYINAAPVFVRNKTIGTDYAGTVATIGFLKATERSITHFYVLKPFYEAESALVQAALKGQAGASVTWLSQLANLTIGGDAKYSDRIDFGAQASLDHMVRKERGNSIFIVDPTITVNAGTQHFLNTYRRKKGIILPREEVVTEEKTAFRILAYELSVPIIFNQGPVQLLATPAYVVPQSLQRGEYGKPLAYISLGAKYSF